MEDSHPDRLTVSAGMTWECSSKEVRTGKAGCARRKAESGEARERTGRKVVGVGGGACRGQTRWGFGGPTRSLGLVLTKGATESYKQGSDMIYVSLLCAESRSEGEQG